METVRVGARARRARRRPLHDVEAPLVRVVSTAPGGAFVAAASIAGYPLHWEADVLLADGGVAHLRPSGPADTGEGDDWEFVDLAGAQQNAHLAS